MQNIEWSRIHVHRDYVEINGRRIEKKQALCFINFAT